MNIYLPMEIKTREIEGKTLLALAAAERGHAVMLGAKEDTVGFARDGLLTPGILHDKSLTPWAKKLKSLVNVRSHGHVITSQDEESGLLDESYESFARQRYSAETCSMVHRIFCWGLHDARALRDLYGEIAGSSIVPTGSPRVDFWRPDLSGYYARDRDAPAVRLGDYVLVSSNFIRPLNVRRFWELLKYRRDRNQFHGDGEYDMYGEAGWATSLLGEFIRMIRCLASAELGVKIVVRPHPTEVEDAWRILIGDYPNILVTREGTLMKWIRGAKLLVHNSCTSGLEAAVARVPRIAYMPVRSKFERPVPNAVSHQVESLDALLQAVRTILKGGVPEIDTVREMRGSAILHERFANLEGALAADRIVDEWEKLSSKSLEVPNNWVKVRRAVFARRLRGGVSQALSRFRHRRRTGTPSVTRHKFPALEDAEMATIVGNLKSSLDRFGTVTYERISDRTFAFRRA